MRKIYIVEAIFSDYESSWEDKIGVYSSLDLAKEAQEKYLEHIQKLKSIEDPRTEEEKQVDTLNLPDELWDKWYDWQDLQQKLEDFCKVYITELDINESPKLYNYE